MKYKKLEHQKKINETNILKRLIRKENEKILISVSRMVVETYVEIL